MPHQFIINIFIHTYGSKFHLQRVCLLRIIIFSLGTITRINTGWQIFYVNKIVSERIKTFFFHKTKYSRGIYQRPKWSLLEVLLTSLRLIHRRIFHYLMSDWKFLQMKDYLRFLGRPGNALLLAFSPNLHSVNETNHKSNLYLSIPISALKKAYLLKKLNLL